LPWSPAIADDAGGARLSELLTAAGVTVYPLALPGATPEKVRMRAGGQVLLRLDRAGDPQPPGPAPAAALDALRDASAILVSDYGRGVARHPELRSALAQTKAPSEAVQAAVQAASAYVAGGGVTAALSARPAKAEHVGVGDAVTRPSVHQAAPDDHGRSPVRRQPAVGECSARTDEGAAAQTPQRSPRGVGEVSPSSARIATASV
jgi:hypothetical protein